MKLFSNLLHNNIGYIYPDKHTFIFKNVKLNLLQLYFFTGFLANFSGYVKINNIVLICFIGSVFFLRFKISKSFSPIIIIYGLLTVLSVFNHLYFYYDIGIPQGARTMPIILVSMIACRCCTVPGMFERAVFLNTLPYVLLIPVGGHYVSGRYESLFLTENIQGNVIPFAFAIGIVGLWHSRKNWKIYSMLFASTAYMFLSASRKMVVYLISSVTILNYKSKRLKLYQTFLFIIILSLVIFILLPIMTNRLSVRFGKNFSWKNHIEKIFAGNYSDKSTKERVGFIKLSLESIKHRWLGYGNANFPFVVKSYGKSYLSIAKHPHSGLAESIITGGLIGAVLYFTLLLYIIRIGFSDPIMKVCIVWLLMQIFFETTLMNRFLWPIMAIAEREIQITSKSKSI